MKHVRLQKTVGEIQTIDKDRETAIKQAEKKLFNQIMMEPPATSIIHGTNLFQVFYWSCSK